MNSFTELNLSAPLQQAIEELGYTTPSPIQALALPLLIGDPTDFIGLAATGTGKTAAFSIPMLERVDTAKKGVQTIILCPTRELALQVAGQVDLLGKYKHVRSVAVYGGSSYGDQIRGLRSGAQVVVGTPGRVLDHLDRGTLDLSGVTTVILDEADEMVSMGFKEDLEKILSGTSRETSNIWLFSATMDRNVRKIAETYLRSPKEAQVNRKEVLSETVQQIFYPARESDKPEILRKIIDAADDFFGIIFCQTKALVTDLTQYLSEHGHKVDCLHGDKTQEARERTTQAFRDRKLKILVCTDVASRGLDVKDVTHVINYSIPRELDSYVHRIGRTARSGKAGLAMSLVTPSQRGLIGRIEQTTRSKMSEGKIPTRKEIGSKKLIGVMEKFYGVQEHTRALELLDEPTRAEIAALSPLEVAARFLMLKFPDIFDDKLRAKGPTMPGPRRDEGGGGGRYGDRPQRNDRNDRPYRNNDRRDDRPNRDDRGPRNAGGSAPAWVERPPRRDVRPPREEGAPAPSPEAKARDDRPQRERPAKAPYAKGPRTFKGKTDKPTFTKNFEKRRREH